MEMENNLAILFMSFQLFGLFLQGLHDFLQHKCIKSKICDRASVYHIMKLKWVINFNSKVIKDQRKETF